MAIIVLTSLRLCAALVIAFQAAGEHSVDLYHMSGNLLQIGKTAVAGAEVINGDAYTGLDQCIELLAWR